MPFLGTTGAGPRLYARGLYEPGPSPAGWRFDGGGPYPGEPGNQFTPLVVGVDGQVQFGFGAQASADNAFAQTLTNPIIAGANVLVQYQGGTFPGADWVAWVPVGQPAGSFLPGWSYVPASSGSISIPAPATPGQYDLLYLINSGFTTYSRLTYTVQAPASIDVNGVVSFGFAAVGLAANHSVKSLTSPILVGASISVEYFGGLFPGADWVTFAPAGSPLTTFLAGWSNTTQRDGTVTVTAPPTAGLYEIRFLQNNQYILYASQSVTVTVPMTDVTGALQFGFGVEATADMIAVVEAEGTLQFGFGADVVAEVLTPVDVNAAVAIGFQSAALAIQHNPTVAAVQLGFGALAQATQTNPANATAGFGFRSAGVANQANAATGQAQLGFGAFASAASVGTATGAVQFGFQGLGQATQTSNAIAALGIGFTAAGVVAQVNTAAAAAQLGFGSVGLADQQAPATATLALGFQAAAQVQLALPATPNKSARINNLTQQYSVTLTTAFVQARFEGSESMDCVYYRVCVGDLLPSFAFKLTQRQAQTGVESPVDLSAATVAFAYKDLMGVAQSRPALVTNAPQGEGVVNWVVGDFATLGQIQGKLRVTVAGKTFTIQDNVTIDVVPV